MTGGAFEVRNIHEFRPFLRDVSWLKEDNQLNSPRFIGNWSNDPAP
jgi:hypothetical protein